MATDNKKTTVFQIMLSHEEMNCLKDLEKIDLSQFESEDYMQKSFNTILNDFSDDQIKYCFAKSLFRLDNKRIFDLFQKFIDEMTNEELAINLLYTYREIFEYHSDEISS